MLKLIFVCGSLEPGRCGVGDYTRLLAGELIRQGHLAQILALNDRHITTVFSGSQQSGGFDIPVLRIPSTCSANERLNYSKSFIDVFNPTWLSLQFVPFSFHAKGLPVGLIKLLGQLGKGKLWHVMFHELWVSVEPGSNWKRFFYMSLQKAVISRLIFSLQPAAIHTHLPAYYDRLERLGQQVNSLPLYPNIFPANNSIGETDESIFRIGVFSQTDSKSDVVEFIINLGNEATKKGQSLEILLIGGNETRMRSFGDHILSMPAFKGQVKYTGFLEPGDVSLALQSCTVGITSVPRHLLGKSGSVVAFLSHGIPVAAPRVISKKEPTEIGFFSDTLKKSILISPRLDHLNEAKLAALKAREFINLSTIAKTFLSDLEKVSLKPTIV